MAATLSRAERLVLDACTSIEDLHAKPAPFTDAVRRAAGQLTGLEFRRVVADLADRSLLRAQVVTKPDGEVGRVLIERVTPLGRRAVGR